MELLCTVKSAIESGDNIEVSVFMLQDWKLEPGKVLEQRRGDDIIAAWKLVEATPKSLVLEKDGREANAIELADGFYAEPPVVEHPIVEIASIPVLLFGGKNWKLASAKKWVPANLVVDGYPSVGELHLDGKEYEVLKLSEGFAARLKAAS